MTDNITVPLFCCDCKNCLNQNDLLLCTSIYCANIIDKTPMRCDVVRFTRCGNDERTINGYLEFYRKKENR